MAVGAIICAGAVMLPTRIALLVQEISTMVLMLSMFRLSQIIEGKDILRRVMKFVSIFFLIIIVASLFSTVGMLLG